MSSTPMIVSAAAPSAPVSAGTSSSSSSNRSTIVFALLIIVLVVLIIFLFTKLNTQNKQIQEMQKELQSLRSCPKMLMAIAQAIGLRENGKGELIPVAEEDNEDDENTNDDQPCNADICIADPTILRTMFANLPASPVSSSSTIVEEEKEKPVDVKVD